jgi:hypothetical protein
LQKLNLNFELGSKNGKFIKFLSLNSPGRAIIVLYGIFFLRFGSKSVYPCSPKHLTVSPLLLSEVINFHLLSNIIPFDAPTALSHAFTSLVILILLP